MAGPRHFGACQARLAGRGLMLLVSVVATSSPQSASPAKVPDNASAASLLMMTNCAPAEGLSAEEKPVETCSVAPPRLN